ncbi:type II/IV secretion system ATPase subunit [Natronobacterium gregoryi]|uniref:ATPase, type IV secretory pathway VirB11 component like protein n=2 Tax=Natronobacterium gregoryi TaxID=44930 RepID=L0AD39_NATGS|nr:type II/IV secretion system ATPase subunit [Natronobacterium gregoryi]AFZ71756.1 ATPase, type IV secretory pathway VirB11 component like protein [Natronobacterium gregoryi SP2]ELY72859.1 type II secretion system protein E [Natronobacterium gregoryi SP2]PLK21063.1 secretion system protein E [Natronobacterium gregoryi SP2]SFI88555.1 flagellar protein FlaI [Natronobacterium gregoryi]
MATDEADQSDAGDISEGEASDAASEAERTPKDEVEPQSSVRPGEYTWADFMEESGYADEVSTLYPDDPHSGDQLGLETGEEIDPDPPSGDDWDAVSFDPASYLGHHPDDIESYVLPTAGDNHDLLEAEFLEYVDPETTPVVKDVWTWEHYKWEYYYEDDGSRPRDVGGEIVPHEPEATLGFDPDEIEGRLEKASDAATKLAEVVDERTVNVQEDVDEDEFFSTATGATTLANRYDLEKAVPLEKKRHFQELERYWVNKPYAYVVIFHSEKENEKKYYVIEPYLNEIEGELQEFLSGKLRKTIKYSDEGVKEKAGEEGRRDVIEEETRNLLKRYDLFEDATDGAGVTERGLLATIKGLLNDEEDVEIEANPDELEGITVRPEPVVLEEDPDTLNEYQVEKLLYLLKRNFIGYERIDGIKHDINVEDISCDGYNSPVFVYHSEYEQIISNVYHGEDELDDFVVKLAQRSGKGISKRLPQVDATLPDGSRAQLTLGKEVSDHGTNYTIRQFKDVPFTPIDLINWNTFSLDEMAFLWLCIENHKSLIFAGGTASGKTTSLNAVSLFIPSSAKIVSIEDTREVELPQRNWIASVTRPSFSDDEQGDVDEFDLLEAALRQRPDYIVMGEIRGEEGRTLFQVMSTGHTTYTTFHADSVDEVLKRFTTDPINVSKTMFTALDLVSIQTQTRVQGQKVRRNKSLTEINHYEAEHDEINVQDVYQWQAETDEFLKMGDSNTLEEIQFDRGWSREKLERELFKRKVILAYLIKNGLNTYAEVAATAQAFINDPDTILTLVANGQLEDSLQDLREMESVLIDVDPEKEELVPRPEAGSKVERTATNVLERAEESLFEQYRGEVPTGLASALGDVEAEHEIEVGAESDDETGGGDGVAETDDWTPSADVTGVGADDAVGRDTDVDGSPAWLADDSGFDVGTDEGDATTTAADPDETETGLVTASESNASTERKPVVDGFNMATADRETDDDSTDTAGPTDAVDQGAAGPGPEPESARGPSADTDDPDSVPSDEPDDEDFAGLFDDIDETLDEINEMEPTELDEPNDTTGDDQPVFSVTEHGFGSTSGSDTSDGEDSTKDDEKPIERSSTANENETANRELPAIDADEDATTEDDLESHTDDAVTASFDEERLSSSDGAIDDEHSDRTSGANDRERDPPTIELGDGEHENDGSAGDVASEESEDGASIFESDAESGSSSLFSEDDAAESSGEGESLFDKRQSPPDSDSIFDAADEDTHDGHTDEDTDA